MSEKIEDQLGEPADQEKIEAQTGEEELEKIRSASSETPPEIEEFNQEMDKLDKMADQGSKEDPNKKRGRLKAAITAVSLMLLVSFSTPNKAEAGFLKDLSGALKGIKKVTREVKGIAKVGGSVVKDVKKAKEIYDEVAKKDKSGEQQEKPGEQQEEPSSQPGANDEQEGR